MEENKQHFWDIMLYYFNRGKMKLKCKKKICTLYAEDAVADQMCQKWFVKFRAGDFSRADALCSGSPGEVTR